MWRNFPSRVCRDRGFFGSRNGCEGRTTLAWESREEAPLASTEAFDPRRLRVRANENAADCFAAFFTGPFVMFSVAVGPDSNAHAGCAEADTAAVFVAPTLDVALARSISVIVAPVADHNMAFTTFASAAAVFIADHANVLNFALRCD